VKILIVSPYPILPPLHGGRVRTAQLASGLARAGARVDVLCPWFPGQPRRAVMPGGFTCHSHFLPSNVLPMAVPWLAAPQALLSFQPPPRRRLAAFADCDVYQFEFCAHASWMRAVPAGAKVVYSAHNVERDYCESDRARRLLTGASLRRIQRLEAMAVRRSDLVLACAPEDGERLRALYGPPARLAVVPHGVQQSLLTLDRQRLRADARARLGLADGDRTLLFLGGAASHNREALDFLVGQVLPRLDAGARLLVVGRTAGGRHATASSRVRFLGFVDDLRPVLAAADVAANPASHGCGASIKLLDYLAAGLPVVATPEAVRGFAGPMTGLRVVPRDRFAEALSGASAPAPPDRAALAHLGWDHVGRDLLAEYERLCA
jgi:glycosyltransferase involved in cell wall biosynthesis